MSEKIGIGIVTYNREHLLIKLLESLYNCSQTVNELIIIDDGGNINPENLMKNSWMSKRGCLEMNFQNLGVAKSKNKALSYLLKQQCDHMFLIEDDIFIKDPTVFEKYIKASKVSGIQHFNFSQHGMMNKTWPENSLSWSVPNPRIIIDYGEVKIPLYPHCVGAFSYYSKKCLEEVGLMDERYYNACEHVDHTLEVIKKGMHPPFWYFADIENSWEYLGDEPWSIEKSTISSNPNHKKMMEDADVVFRNKHGCVPVDIKLLSIEEVGKQLKNIRENYGN
jgi:GT2 family glycosyltransferase